MGAPSSAPRDLAQLTGAGDRRAFRKLYNLLAPDVFAAAAAELPDPDQAMHVLRATFCELWWLSGCFNGDPGERHIATWACDIARTRAIERRAALCLVAGDPAPTRIFWAELLASQDTSVRAIFHKVLDTADDPVPTVLA